jgi:nickel-dependent lactate racemase
MLLYARGNENDNLTSEDLKEGLHSALDKLGSRKKVLAIPPDFTRYHSRAGDLTALTWQYYREALTDVLPALGTHAPMTPSEIEQMFEGVGPELFRKHNWRTDLVTLGEVPAEFVREVSEGRVDYGWPAQVNRLLVEGGFDLALSIGQVVPHEVSGMANYNKNIFIGTGGADGINRSHFLGAAYGMERIMGRADNPVRRVIKDMPVVYMLTVVSADKDGNLKTRGLFIGDDVECFNLAAELSLKVNFQMLDEPLQKVVVHLDPSEYKSTWLGNKSIYRTRMAMADGGELIVLAPGVSQFGEDAQIDRLIRKYGYVGTPGILDAVQKNDDLRENLSAAAHLIHGSSEGRFTITYCPGKLSKQEIEAANFGYAELEQMKSRYNPARLSDGLNTLADGEEVFFISNPAIGLWAYRGRFGQD